MAAPITPAKNQVGLSPEQQDKYVEARKQLIAFLLDPNSDESVTKWSERMGYDRTTVFKWLREDATKEALKQWREPMSTSIPGVVRAMFDKAQRGDVNAARLIGDWFGLNAPKKIDADITGHVEYMPQGSLMKLAQEVIEGEVVALAEGNDAERTEDRLPPALASGEGPRLSGEVPGGSSGTAGGEDEARRGGDRELGDGVTGATGVLVGDPVPQDRGQGVAGAERLPAARDRQEAV